MMIQNKKPLDFNDLEILSNYYSRLKCKTIFTNFMKAHIRKKDNYRIMSLITSRQHQFSFFIYF